MRLDVIESLEEVLELLEHVVSALQVHAVAQKAQCYGRRQAFRLASDI